MALFNLDRCVSVFFGSCKKIDKLRSYCIVWADRDSVRIDGCNHFSSSFTESVSVFVVLMCKCVYLAHCCVTLAVLLLSAVTATLRL